jgi:hypothetical protein
MTNQLIIPDRSPQGESNRSLITSPETRIIRTSPKQISRNGLSKLHQDSSKSKVAQTAQIATSGLQQAMSSGLKIVSNTSKNLINFTNQSTENKNIKNLVYGVIGSIFGLSTLKGLLEIPKQILGKADGKTKAPMLLKSAQWLSGGAIALGAFKTFTGAGLTNPALMIGIGVFLFFKALNSSYENENSPISKILETLGLRDRIKTMIDDTQVDQLLA